MHRRALVSAVAASAVAPMLPGVPRRGAAAQEATPVAGLDDGLAHPAPMTPGLGVGKDRALGHLLGEVHEWLNVLFIAVLVGHVAAALKHHFIDRDDVLRRMLPRH